MLTPYKASLLKNVILVDETPIGFDTGLTDYYRLAPSLDGKGLMHKVGGAGVTLGDLAESGAITLVSASGEPPSLAGVSLVPDDTFNKAAEGRHELGKAFKVAAIERGDDEKQDPLAALHDYISDAANRVVLNANAVKELAAEFKSGGFGRVAG